MRVGADFPVYSRIRRFFPDFAGKEFPVRNYCRRLVGHFKYLIELMFQTTHRVVVGPDSIFYREFSRRTGNLRGFSRPRRRARDSAPSGAPGC